MLWGKATAYFIVMCNVEHVFISTGCDTIPCFDFLHQLNHALAAGCTLCGIMSDNNRVVYRMFTSQPDYTCITVRKSIEPAGNCNLLFGKKIIEKVKRWW